MPKKEKIVTAFFNESVSVYFQFFEKKFGFRPSFDGSAPRDLKTILDAMKKRTEERTKANPLYVKFIDGIKFLEKKRDETKFTLNIDKVKKEEEENKKLTESFKVEKENEDLVVSKFEDSLNKGITIAPGDQANFKREFKDRADEWIKGIRTDLNLIEAINILNDMVMVEKGKKLTMK